ncbi:MAG: AtpZ/AtpI family protein [Gemmobacter sp.]
MAEEPDPERLRALEARLRQVRGNPTVQQAPAGKAFSQGEMAWRMVIELVSGMLLGLAIGYGLDLAFGTLPVFLVIFVLLGFVAGVRTMLGTARTMAGGDTAGVGKKADETRG